MKAHLLNNKYKTDMYSYNILLPTSSRLFWTQKADMRHHTAVDAPTNRASVTILLGI